MPLARISLTLSRHFSLSFIDSGRSSRLHPVSSHSCCMYVRAGRTAFARPYVGVHRSTSLISSSLLLRLCPACLARLTWIVYVMGGRWPYSWYLVGCCHWDLNPYLTAWSHSTSPYLSTTVSHALQSCVTSWLTWAGSNNHQLPYFLTYWLLCWGRLIRDFQNRMLLDL